MSLPLATLEETSSSLTRTEIASSTSIPSSRKMQRTSLKQTQIQHNKTESESELNAWLALNPSKPFPILNLPITIILQIFTSLDIPDLDSLKSTGHQLLMSLANDSVLHQHRLRSVGTTCLEPYLLNRPNRLDLAKSKILKGLNLEFKINSGSYLHSPTSIKTYETSEKINRLIIKNKLTKALESRPIFYQLTSFNLIDEELKNEHVSASLAPMIRSLKRERVKDQLAQQMRYNKLLNGIPIHPSKCWEGSN
ncbi:uncharacterized protein MELLADRAFT_102459 [Melampsora larici-populina 98AG31]|uniref:F-box domain-containing protein n=1 Tax=Melampsora larici-populina (strain 98AG31 / pathotype 3-4-7) TaxID=747676 RepID=F4R8E0_MELLP|nr:uncharacterized protein MELLADRAFT_102459 [Melampsora larici-populina 98AG31]EGG11623.1 hypothetical protein MELLADRAFT_102459 [Melampsora larici-populina 98AG31]